MYAQNFGLKRRPFRANATGADVWSNGALATNLKLRGHRCQLKNLDNRIEIELLFSRRFGPAKVHGRGGGGGENGYADYQQKT